MNIALEGPATEIKIVQELLSPWDITFTGLDDSDIAIVYKQKPPVAKNAVIIPSDSEEFNAWSKNAQLETTKRINDSQVCVSKTAQITLSVKPKILYQFRALIASESNSSIGAQIGSNFVLGLDVISECIGFFSETLAAQQSKLYRALTGLPIPYGIAPKQVRDYIMKNHSREINLTLNDKLHVDALRLILVQAIRRLAGRELKQKTWNGQGFACLMTHDIENYEGLQRAPQVKKLEEKYDIPSAWFIPSKRYTLKDEIVKTLTNYGEVGAHDTKHDGKLANLSKESLVERLSDAKQSLKKISESPIDGFRAPLLQHNFQILEALHASGYAYDASIPTWEPKHPYTMKAHGIGTVFPFYIDGFPEVPLTVPQDHQMLHALGMTPQQTIKAWTQMMHETKAMGGLCVFLTHPNELASQENQNAYEELLNSMANEKNADMILPITVVENLNNSA